MTKALPILQYIIPGAALLTLTGCAQYPAKRVTARPIPPVSQQPLRIQIAPLQEPITPKRTIPGTVLDPEATTYTQVPERIIYIPGHNTIFSRTSPEQQVAYNLVPVSRTPENQPETPPYFEGKTVGTEQTRSVFTTSFTNTDTTTTTGTARRLSVTSQHPSEKERARQLLRENEQLKWNETVGWIGFTPIETTQTKPTTPPPPPPKEVAPDPQPEPKKQEIPHGTPPNSQNKAPSSNPAPNLQKTEKLIDLGQ